MGRSEGASSCSGFPSVGVPLDVQALRRPLPSAEGYAAVFAACRRAAAPRVALRAYGDAQAKGARPRGGGTRGLWCG